MNRVAKFVGKFDAATGELGHFIFWWLLALYASTIGRPLRLQFSEML
jgi:hypothetical protein